LKLRVAVEYTYRNIAKHALDYVFEIMDHACSVGFNSYQLVQINVDSLFE